VYAADSNFTMQLAVGLRSVANLHPSARVYVLHDRVTVPGKKQVTRALPPSIDVHWIDLDMSQLDDIRIPDYLSRAALSRLGMGELLPAEIDRVLYLDADTLVCEPLDELWEVELGEHVLGAVRDASVPWAGAPRGLAWQTLRLDPDTPYFNTGVMVVSLGEWRSRDVGTRAFELLATHDFRWPDQDALNAVFRGDWEVMKPKWNVQAAHVAEQGSLGWIAEDHADMARALEAPAIVHFNFSPMNRPWQPRCRHPQRQRWLNVLDTTPWAGWRPAEPRESVLARLARRLRRSLRVLLTGAP
jgi:lipopolysaccharide biosynthesis glycosyltransferase